MRSDPQHLAFELTGDRSRVVTLAMAWSPKWKARFDDRPVRLGRDGDSMMTVVVPSGTGTLELDYRPDRADWVGLAVSGLALLVVVGALTRRSRWARRLTTLVRLDGLTVASPPPVALPAATGPTAGDDDAEETSPDVPAAPAMTAP